MKKKKSAAVATELDSSGSQSPGPRIGSDIDADSSKIVEKVTEEAMGSTGDNPFMSKKDA